MKQILLFIVLSLSLSSFAKEPKAVWRENFHPTSGKNNLPPGWELKATQCGINKTSFKLGSKTNLGFLKVFADKSTGALFCEPYKSVDLKKTPILRWRWRVNSFPKGGDGRKLHRDDQAIAIYVGASDWMLKKSIAYRWETDTPKGHEGLASYLGGVLKVKWFCVRNQASGKGKWVIEERNIAEDFKKAFGFIPETFVLSIGANSQHTKSESLAYIDYIEFVSLAKAKMIKLTMKN